MVLRGSGTILVNDEFRKKRILFEQGKSVFLLLLPYCQRQEQRRTFEQCMTLTGHKLLLEHLKHSVQIIGLRQTGKMRGPHIGQMGPGGHEDG